MKYIKLFESQNKSKTKQGIFKGYVYITFHGDDKREDKEKILNMLKEYYKIENYTEKQAMQNNVWAWIIWFFDSFDDPGLDLNVVTTPRWHISEDYNQISAKELIGIGLENMETYFTAKKYNL